MSHSETWPLTISEATMSSSVLSKDEVLLLFKAHPSGLPGGAGILTDEFGVADMHFQTVTGFTEDNPTSVGDFSHVQRH